MPPAPAVTAADIQDLIIGVTLLGSGGGGDARTLGRLLRRSLGESVQRLHRSSELADHTVVPIGVVGATSVFLEKLPSGRELAGAVAAVSRWTGTAVSAVMPLEAGGLNGIAAIVGAVQLGLPLLDVDLMGRALPRLDQLSWSIEGHPLAPCALCEPGGQTVVIDRASASDLERTTRAFLSQSGGWAAIALRPVPVTSAAHNGIHGSLARALKLGSAHGSLPERPSAHALEETLGGRVLGSGRVRSITRHRGDPTKSAIHVEDRDRAATVRVEAQNEYLLGFRDGQLLASTPDLICLLDRRTCLPIAVDQLRVADDVTVISLPGPAWWQVESRGRFVGPEAFGLGSDRALEVET